MRIWVPGKWKDLPKATQLGRGPIAFPASLRVPKCMCGRTWRQRGPLSFGCQENWGLVTWGCFEEVTSWRCWAGSGLLFPRDKIPLFRVKNNHNKIIPECWERSDFQVWGCWQREWRQSGARLAPLFYIPSMFPLGRSWKYNYRPVRGFPNCSTLQRDPPI